MKRLLVTVDSLRYDHYQYMSNTLDFLGESHDRAFSTASATMRAFPTMMTGDYDKDDREISPGDSFVSDIDDWSIGITSNRLVSERYGYDDGFDHFTSPINRGDESVKDQIAPKIPDSLYGIASDLWSLYQKISEPVSETSKSFRSAEDIIDEFLDETSDREDWFAWLHFMEPHHPYDPNPDSRARDQAISREAISTNHTDDPDKVKELYWKEVMLLDQQLDDLWDSLDDDVDVVFTADHGEMLGEGGVWGHPGGLLEPEILRIPFATRGFDIDSDVISFMDVSHILQGSFDGREVAFSSMGTQKAAMNRNHIATEDGVRDFDGNLSEDDELMRELESFEPSGITKQDGLEEDLRALGYVD